MNRAKRIRSMSGMLAWWGLSVGLAQAAVTYPVDRTTHLPLTTSAVTLSILQTSSTGTVTDVTDRWLPEPGKVVTLRVNNLANPTLSLVVLPAGTAVTFDGRTNPFLNTSTLVTSAYPGQCGNNVSQDTPDFTLTGNQLTTNDCGGMAVVQVNNGAYTFIVPQDSDADGMPNVWEAQYCAAPSPNCLVPTADIDTGPGTLVGDGLANFDEYRGFMVSGQYQRTSPLQKDLFVHVVNPQCGTTSLLPTYGGSLFANLNTLISGSQIRVLGYNPQAPSNGTTTEWVDRFVNLTLNSSGTNVFTYRTASGATATVAPADDRQINKNALYPIADIITGSKVQKGLRLTECVDSGATTNTTTLLGSAGWGSANGPDNAVIYTQRIVNYVTTLIQRGGSTPVRYSTFVNGAWGAPQAIDNNTLISKVVAFYTAMEIGHSIKLTTTSSTYGYHHAPGTGDNLDQNIVNKLTSGTSNLFQVPSLFSITDQSGFKIRN